jgi:hypothetical protein
LSSSRPQSKTSTAPPLLDAERVRHLPLAAFKHAWLAHQLFQLRVFARRVYAPEQ